MTGRYLAAMLSVMGVDAALTGLYVLMSGRMDVLPSAIAVNVLVLGVMNGVGAWLLFRPIAAYLSGREPPARVVPAIRRLTRRSVIWTMTVTVVYSAALFALGVFTPEDASSVASLKLRAFMLVWFLFVYGVYFCFVVGFAVTDVVAILRAEVFRQDGVVMPAEGGSMAVRLIVAFGVVTIMPVAVTVLDVAVFEDIRRAQGLGTERVVILDLFGALIAAAVALVFVTRSVTRPVARMAVAARQVAAGELGVRVPVTTDDELGELGGGFNGMVSGLRERALIRDTFGRYVSDSVARAILEDPSLLKSGRLSGREAVATLLFADLKSFTALCEDRNPAQVLGLLDEYLTLIAEPIHRHGGVISAFFGDAVLATFNLPLPDPDHPVNGVRCALAIQDSLGQARFSGGVKLKARIGINTGRVVSGSVGPPDRLAYMVLGAAVNVASRLESANKVLGTDILVSDTTRQACADRLSFEAMGTVPVKGVQDPIAAYRPWPIVPATAAD